ncbi:unnamed protein product [Cuscuta epithymum]|uniref:Uncharacterized protein n=1 Tax=Cuscuta epithymum TaxID=186058 RepID=A0AAV0DL05_9ASTE|nr:unnamed protein product [Cuscuta epithymum]
MAPLQGFPASCRGFLIKVLPVLLLLLVSSFLAQVHSHSNDEFTSSSDRHLSPTRRKLLEVDEDEDQPPVKIKKTSSTLTLSSSKNKTKLLKPTSSSTSTTSKNNQTNKVLKTGSGFGSTKNQTKVKLSSILSSSKNKTKLLKTVSESAKLDKIPISKNQTKKLIDKIPVGKNQTKKIMDKTPLGKIQIKKLNSTSLKTSNSTKTTKKSSDLAKLNSSSSSKNKTSSTKEAKSNQLEKPNPKSKPQTSTKPTETSKSAKPESAKKISTSSEKPFGIDDEQDDLISDFRDMPSKFQQTLLPDLERISKTSKVYINKANREITNNFKPYVGNKYASTAAAFISFAFIVIPLILVSLVFNRFKAYFSLQKLLIFVQIYLSIYFSILCLSSLVTGLEPLKFFYATSQSTYICIQLLQTLAYVLYLLMLLMYLVLVFSTETGPSSKMIGLGQTVVGFAVGLHYYMAVFHRAVLRQPPKTSWRVHAIYATCFLAICLLTQAERKKKAYLEEGGEEGKKS